jgi:L-threonylcarbamoyladenylate synthase
MTVLPFVTPEDRRTAAPRVADHLGAGGLLAYPTETVYGLGSRARAADVAALSRLKGRTAGKPFLLLISHRRMAEAAGLLFTPAANALAEACWPGPLTLILPGGGGLPDSLRGPEGGIAVRWTSHRGVAELIEFLGDPTAPGVGAIVELFGAAVGAGQLLVLDGGVLGNVPPSTVVDCTARNPRIVREGALPRAELHQRVGSFAP